MGYRSSGNLTVDAMGSIVLFVTLPAPNPSQILQIKRRYSINYSDV